MDRQREELGAAVKPAQTVIFRQDPTLSPETYTLEETRLVITTGGLGTKEERAIPLWKMSPDFNLTQKRHYRFVLTPLLPVVAVFVFVRWFGRLNILPLEFVIGPALLFAVVLLWHAVRGFHPVEASLFKDRKGEDLVEIYRPRKESAAIDYEEFVAALSNRIKAVRATERDVY